MIIAAVAKVSCKHGLWLVARVKKRTVCFDGIIFIANCSFYFRIPVLFAILFPGNKSYNYCLLLFVIEAGDLLDSFGRRFSILTYYIFVTVKVVNSYIFLYYFFQNRMSDRSFRHIYIKVFCDRSTNDSKCVLAFQFSSVFHLFRIGNKRNIFSRMV